MREILIIGGDHVRSVEAFWREIGPQDVKLSTFLIDNQCPVFLPDFAEDFLPNKSFQDRLIYAIESRKPSLIVCDLLDIFCFNRLIEIIFDRENFQNEIAAEPLTQSIVKFPYRKFASTFIMSSNRELDRISAILQTLNLGKIYLSPPFLSVYKLFRNSSNEYFSYKEFKLDEYGRYRSHFMDKCVNIAWDLYEEIVSVFKFSSFGDLNSFRPVVVGQFVRPVSHGISSRDKDFSAEVTRYVIEFGNKLSK